MSRLCCNLQRLISRRECRNSLSLVSMLRGRERQTVSLLHVSLLLLLLQLHGFVFNAVTLSTVQTASFTTILDVPYGKCMCI